MFSIHRNREKSYTNYFLELKKYLKTMQTKLLPRDAMHFKGASEVHFSQT